MSVCFGIAIGFALLGAWPVLPFAGLEMAVLVWAFHNMACHAGDYERISFSGDRLTVESRDYKRLDCAEFNRFWARLILRRDVYGDCRLALRSHGREIELGRYTDNAGRLALAGQLEIQLSGNRI